MSPLIFVLIWWLVADTARCVPTGGLSHFPYALSEKLIIAGANVGSINARKVAK